MPEGSIYLTLNKNDMWKFGTLTVSPFDWMEASYFYYRPSDLIWEGNFTKGHYLDKGFNVKFTYRPKNISLPNFALGLDDFAGTGFFTREYIVASKNLKNTKISLGMGWGKFVGENNFDNPLSFISSSMKTRPTQLDKFNLGGTVSYEKWFKGDATIFGGLEHRFKKFKGLKLKLEYDPFDYLDFSAQNRFDADINLREKESNLNFGLSYTINDYVTVNTSYIKGNILNFNISIGLTLNKKTSKKPKFDPNLKKSSSNNDIDSFYIDLLTNLNNNRLYLQTANLDPNSNLEISISTSEHRNAIRSSSYSAYIANQVSKNNNINLSTIQVSHLNAGIELNNIKYIAKYLDEDNLTPIEVKIRNTELKSGEVNSYISHEFKPKVNFPVIFSSFSPVLISHIGNPEKFYFGGINLQNVSEIQFNRNLLLSTELNYRIYDNFKDTISGPSSNMQHVRTDLVQYLKSDDIYLSRMQLDYIWSPSKNVYSKISSGIFEPMYGGVGAEVLIRPFKKNFSIGAEIFYVRQRSFDQKLNFKKYKTTTGHINLGYKFAAGIEANISYGRYLAKDDGYTVDIGRRTNSGFKSGFYFTKTNVSAELFGEGSFDKGFYFQIPMDLLSGEYSGNYSSIKISPLTRDGGAKLIHDKDLKGMIYNSTFNDLINQWDGYLD